MKYFFIFAALLLATISSATSTSCGDANDDKSTICSFQNGTSGCCPMREAVCCSDGQFCCPKGFTCDLSGSKCVKNDETMYIPFHVRIQGLSSSDKMNGHVDILCPDNVTSCKETQTCCLFEQGQYGCCPLADAVCCDDKKHCCPRSYKCNPSQGKCDRDNESIMWVEKVHGTRKQVQSVVCPGGTAQCPDGNTCCQLASGDWGCCPLPQAVCCPDHEHCCPNGYTCDPSTARCDKGDISIPFYKKTKAQVIEKKVKDVPCPGGTAQCPDQNTCCQLPSGEWGCCPLPNATCCSDHEHCCPNGYTCKAGSCKKGDISLPFYKKIKATATKKQVESVVCPGGSSQCPDGNTCCQLASGDWGCCPLPQAVCCPDHEHCCPNGYTCDPSTARCDKGDISLPFYKKTKAQLIEKKVKDVPCPGGTAQCPDGNTCCQLASGQWGCCPLPNATCCSDHEHCCPNGYTCKSGQCKKGEESIPWFTKTEARRIARDEEPVVCFGGQAQCPNGNTCCQLSSGEWGCCPLSYATCCDDHEHCCPSGYTCNTLSGRCNKGIISLPFYRKMRAIATPVVEENVKDVPCPGGTAQCPDGNTCCQLASGQWGCCPLPNATCCSDHEHCCPNGYTCKSGQCKKGEESIPWFTKTEAKSLAVKKEVKDVVCPGGESQCPDESTCCELASGDWGCCPFPNGICCLDKLHCCPEGYTCDSASGKCSKGNISFRYMLKQKAAEIKEHSVVCPGGSAQCPDGNTCCQLASGDWGCCPLPQAVCCPDHEHCCPNGYTCDPSTARCDKGDISIPFYKKTKAQVIEKKVKDVPCPGGTAQCPDQNTCCQLPSGEWGCCPLPNATCCSDHEHCCPNGYTCKAGSCKKGDISLPFYKKIKATATKKQVESVVCPGGSSQCPDGNTCCQLASGDWGCCPLPQAVCCPDHEHCCPNGYTCDPSTARCDKGDISLPFYKKTKAQVIEKKVESVVCPGGSSQCPDGNTCCQLASGDWGCCPLPQAVCCPDHEHCCPNGYTCDTSTGRCDKGDISLPFYQKVKAIAVQLKPVETENKVLNKNFSNLTSVVCPDGCSFCPEGYTCCKMSTGSYGCCPLPNAVCCQDHSHCCPKGTQCNMEKQCCDPASSSTADSNPSEWFEKQPSQKLYLTESDKLNKVAQNPVICQDNLTTCDPLKVCCRMQNGAYGCCPYSDGICCESTSSCCPANTECGKGPGDCISKSTANLLPRRQFSSNWHTIELKSEQILLDKLSSSTTKNETTAVCPGGEVQCASTCCQRTSDSNYLCCPYANGTCCGAHGYCCPTGYTCDPKAESCTLNDDNSIEYIGNQEWVKRIDDDDDNNDDSVEED